MRHLQPHPFEPLRQLPGCRPRPLLPPVQERLQYLRRVRQGGDVFEVMFAVRSDLLRNLGNMTSR